MEHPKTEPPRTRGSGAYLGPGLLVAAPLGVYFVYPVRVIVLVSLLTLLFAVVLGAPVDYLVRRGLGRAWGLLAVAAGLFLVLQFAQDAMSPLVAQARRLAEEFPALLSEVHGLAGRLPFGLGGGIAPLLEPNRLIQTLRDTGLSVGTVLNVGSSAAGAPISTAGLSAPRPRPTSATRSSSPGRARSGMTRRSCAASAARSPPCSDGPSW